jgi:hypothetical protein
MILFTATQVGATVTCGGVDRDSCYQCPPEGGLKPGEILSNYCGGECMVDPSGHFCILGSALKERHLAYAEGLLTDYEKLTRKTLNKLHRTDEKNPASLLKNMNTALTAARIMQSSLKESLDKTTEKTRRVSCGGHDADTCEQCMGPNDEKLKCNGDCMHDGEICVLKPTAPSLTFGGDAVKLDDEAIGFIGLKKPTVSCGGVDKDRCELCEKPGEGASTCHGDCYYSAGGVCVPIFATMQRHSSEAEDSLQTLLQFVDHGYYILQSDKETVDVSDPALGLQKQFPAGGLMELHKDTDRDLDLVQGIVPKIQKLLRRSEVELEQASPKVSCGGSDADSCAECMPPPGSGHEIDVTFCNGDCHFHMGECVHKGAASLLAESDQAKLDDEKAAAEKKAKGSRQLRTEDISEGQ